MMIHIAQVFRTREEFRLPDISGIVRFLGSRAGERLTIGRREEGEVVPFGIIFE
jgi:hypothetical protein